MNETIIISPHADDEIIGTFEVLQKTECTIIYTEYMDPERKEETQNLPHFFNIKNQLYIPNIPGILLDHGNTYYFPDPTTELHPAHREQGSIGEQLARSGYDVIFYTTNMNAPYMREVKNPDSKREALEEVYYSQSDLWKYDAKYFLFEGYTKWIF